MSRAQTEAESSYVATIYFVRHGEVADDPGGPLAPRGLERASDLARTLDRVEITHVFASHTLRSRQAVETAAGDHGLKDVPRPPPGSQIQGQLIHDTADADLAIEPLAAVLCGLPAQRKALVGVNSDNVFAVINELGVPVGTPE